MERENKAMPKLKIPQIGPYMFSLLLFSILVLVDYGRNVQCPLGQSGFSCLVSWSGSVPLRKSMMEPEPPKPASEPTPPKPVTEPAPPTPVTEPVPPTPVTEPAPPTPVTEPEPPKFVPEREKLPFALRETNASCDLFTGTWIWDNVTHPLYKEEECPYIDSQLSCLANGRPEKSYQFWRWQPDGCDLPRFNATFLLESLRGKKMLYVGDSLNRGQFYSMVCLVHSAVPETERSMVHHDSFITFHAKNFNATVEFYWAPFLQESNCDDVHLHKIVNNTVRINSTEKHGVHWNGADVMIFDSYVWWLWKLQLIEGSFEDEPLHFVNIGPEQGYDMAIRGVLKWVKEHIDPKKARVFFTGISPSHIRSDEWGGQKGGNCYNETTIIEDKNYWSSDTRKGMMQVIRDEFAKFEYPMTLLNITQLSSYRKDAHVSIYKKHWRPLTAEQLANPFVLADCLHLCLPGLQDTWNELLFAKLFYP